LLSLLEESNQVRISKSFLPGSCSILGRTVLFQPLGEVFCIHSPAHVVIIHVFLGFQVDVKVTAGEKGFKQRTMIRNGNRDAKLLSFFSINSWPQ
jgi:hypothetical protein